MKELDKFQTKAADIIKNAVVSAGAGSGKTTVLSERAVNLITKRNIKIEELLVLTFTKKATVEMKSRIFLALKAEAENGNKNALLAVQRFDAAHIQTLDSYCAEIARAGAHFFGIAPSFSQDKTKAENAVKSRALPFLLEHKDEIAIRALAKTMDYDKIAQSFFAETILEHSSVANEIDFLKDLENQAKEITGVWEKHAKSAESIIKSIRSLFSQGDFNQKNKFASNIFSALREECEMSLLSEENVKNADTAQIDKYLLNLGKWTNFSLVGTGNVSGSLCEIKRLLPDLFDEIDTLLSIENFAANYKISLSAAALLQNFQSEVNKHKRVSGILTFKDVSELALKTLKEFPEIRLAEKKKFRAIMIDEFQDNNDLQRELLFMLAEKIARMEKGVPCAEELESEKLFFVGDEKQSIYRFRGADVSVFRKLKETLKGADGSGNLELKTNYRSRPELIAAFNTIFGGFPYPTQNGNSASPSIFIAGGKSEVPDYEAEYSKVDIPESKLASADWQNRRVHINLFLDEKKSDENGDSLKAIENEAAFVAAKIKELVDSGRFKASEIAILLKSTTNQAVFERMLLAQGLPYSTEIFKGFFADGPVNDIASYLSLIANPHNDNAYAELLCSPFVNLTFDEAAEVLSAKRNLENALNEEEKAKIEIENANLEEGKKIFRAAKTEPFLEETAANLSESARQRFLSAGQRFFETAELAKIGRITNIVSRIWYELGYCYETMWNRTVDMYSYLYDMIFEIARNADSNAKSIAEFADEFQQYRDEKQKVEDLDIPLEERDCVKIMTIHKSKGLEFKAVFVSGISGRGVQDSNSEPVFISKDFGAVVNTPKSAIFSEVKSKGKNKEKRTVSYFYDIARSENEAKAGAELRRLAYVAFTRAEEELFVTGSFGGNFDKATKDLPCDVYLPGVPGELIEGTNLAYKLPTTIYNLMLPIFAHFIQDGKTSLDAPFDFALIGEQNRESFGAKTHTRKNTAQEKDALILDLQKTYGNAKEIEADFEKPIYVSPSNLHEEDAETARFWKNRKNEEAKFSEIDELVKADEISEIDENSEIKEKSGNHRFSYRNFGNMAHAYLESLFSENGENEKPKNLKSEDTDLLSESNLKKAIGICKEICEDFKKTEIFQRAQKSTWKRAEYAFRASLKNKKGETRILRGSMDLVFREDGGIFTIVDYKTGAEKNPEKYAVQLACYKNALSRIWGDEAKEIRCVLYYPRFQAVCDITEACSRISAESLDIP